MRVVPYTLDELNFAFACHVYYRCHTYLRRVLPALRKITAQHLEAAHPEIHLLNIEASDVDLALLASLQPTESVASGAGKLKGAASKTIRALLQLDRPEKLLGGGYFACTSGPATSEELDRYLENQAEHHGYHRRTVPPVYVQTWAHGDADDQALQASHSATRIRWHLVFSTWNRQGTFTREAAAAITANWEEQTATNGIRLVKASWVPDHVHLALAAHPAVVPATLVPMFLNTSQELMVRRFEGLVIQTGNPRVWKPGAYVGTYGDLATAQIQAFLRHWDRNDETGGAGGRR